MASEQKRRALRYSVHLPASLNVGRRACQAEIVDAGFGGVFVRTALAPALRQLVQLQASPLPGGQPLSFHGMVVHVVPAANPHGHSQGVGIQFYAVDGPTRAIWDQYIRQLERAGHPSQPALPLPLCAELPGALRRRFLRHAAVLQVIAADLQSLVSIYDIDLPAGRMFVPWPDDVPADKLVFVHISHPSHPATFLLEAVVEQSIQRATPPGLLVRFLGLGAERRQAFLDFIHAGVDTESEVQDDTPTLELTVSELLESEIAQYETLDDCDYA